MENIKRNIAASAVLAGALAVLFTAGCANEDPYKPLAVKEGQPGQNTSSLEMARGSDLPKEVTPLPSGPITEERTFYDFERGNLEGWEVPQWAEGKNDYVAKSAEVSADKASRGKHSLKVNADFPGGYWTAALVEIQQYLNLSRYRVIKADIYLPEDAPVGLTAKLILTVGDNWRFVEMNRSYPLIPGEWLEITASIEPGSYDWKRTVPDEKFSEDIRKIAVRIESNNKPVYKGDIFIDNVRVGR